MVKLLGCVLLIVRFHSKLVRGEWLHGDSVLRHGASRCHANDHLARPVRTVQLLTCILPGDCTCLYAFHETEVGVSFVFIVIGGWVEPLQLCLSPAAHIYIGSCCRVVKLRVEVLCDI